MFFEKNKISFMDGGMGSLLQKRGLKNGELPETWNLTHAEDIISIHKEYIEAGSRYILTNTFGINPVKLPELKDSLEEIVSSAISNAKEAAKRAGLADEVKVGLDIGPTGKLMEPLGELSFDDAYDAFALVMKYGEKAGADFIQIETMTDIYEVKAAVLAAKENTSLPVAATVAFGKDGKLLTGSDASIVCEVLEGLRVDALGMNCGLGPVQVLPILKEFKKYTNLPIIVKPNAGLPGIVDGKTVYSMDPHAFADAMEELVKAGAVYIGGCCGTDPEYICKTVEKCKNLKPLGDCAVTRTVVTSYCRTVEFGGKPIIIGERLNPSGKEVFKKALYAEDMDYVQKEAAAQEEEGSDILDVNVGLPDLNEPELMVKVTKSIQKVSPLPIACDTTNYDAMEQAMRYFNGTLLVDSVSGRQDSMDRIFPLMQKYGGTTVALTLDEKGIPATAEERADIAGRIIEEAAKYGISKNHIIVDTLAMSVSAKKDGARVAIDTIKLIRERYGIYTSLGVSNISFGLPARSTVTSVFFAQALEAGLNCAIMNSGSLDMMKVYHVHNMFNGFDENCRDYVAFASDMNEKYSDPGAKTAGKSGTKASLDSRTASNDSSKEKKDPSDKTNTGSGKGSLADKLNDAVIKGLKSEAMKLAEKLLHEMKPLDIINDCIVTSLNKLGDGFEEGDIFLPGLITGAEAAQSACGVIKEAMLVNGKAEQKKGKFVLCTVKDDIHDIGKNIVKILLENYGFDVVDLGKNVAPEEVVKTIKETGAPMVGLSALMTTTACNMEETVRQIREAGLDCKIAVGGAVITPEYAEKIGADYYCEDAMQTVKAAREVLG